VIEPLGVNPLSGISVRDGTCRVQRFDVDGSTKIAQVLKKCIDSGPGWQIWGALVPHSMGGRAYSYATQETCGWK